MHRRESLRALLALPISARERLAGSPHPQSSDLAWVDVRSTGATGTGRSDDSTAIQRALERVARGGTVYVPPGTYLIEQTLSPRFTSRFMNGVQVRMCLDAGAILLGGIPSPGAAVIDCRESVGQEGSFRIEGGIIEGMSGRAGTGVRIATCNVSIEGTAIRRFSSAGIDFGTGGDAPPIRPNFHRVALLFNGVGLRCTVSASGMVIDRCWIEGNAEEGVILHGAGHVSIRDSVMETNGIKRRNAPQLLVLGQETTSVHVFNCYFESPMDQVNSQVAIEGAEAPVRTFLFTGNRVTGSRLSGAAGVSLGERGVVDTALIMGNTFVGNHVGVSVGRYVRDYRVFGNSWSDSFAQASMRRIAVDPRRRELVRSFGIGDVDERAPERPLVRRVTSDTLIAPDDAILLCDAAANDIGVTLEPAAVAVRQVVIKKIDSTRHAVKVLAQSGDHVDHTGSLILHNSGQAVTLQSDGSRWWNIGSA